MTECIIVGMGGFIGAVCRYLVGLLPVKESFVFPIKTFGINIIGCFLIGIIAALALESCDLLGKGNVWIAFLYLVLSVALGVAAVFAGQWIVS